jgi:dihydroflavonol-4-reductase
MLIAVTGASGHVGANLCRMLLQQGHAVRALLYHDDRALQNIEVQKIKGDVLDKSSLKSLINGCDIVFHLAAHISITGKQHGQVKDINVHGTENVIDISIESGIRRLIHFSSIHAISQFPLEFPLDENRPFIETLKHSYDNSKRESELLVKNAVLNKGLNAIILNPTSIIGPFDFKPSLMGSALIKLFTRKLPALVVGGYDWVDVRDVCQGAINAINRGTPGEKYILSGYWHSLKEISEKISELTGITATHYVCPSFLAKISVPFFFLISKITGKSQLYTLESLEILKNNNHFIVSEKAKNELGYVKRPFNETLLDTYHWFNENGYL